MKTQKMSLANIQGKLSRMEMKNLKGGGQQWHCGCANHAGAWSYSNTPTMEQRGQDVATYCRGGGACWLTKTEKV